MDSDEISVFAVILRVSIQLTGALTQVHKLYPCFINSDNVVQQVLSLILKPFQMNTTSLWRHHFCCSVSVCVCVCVSYPLCRNLRSSRKILCTVPDQYLYVLVTPVETIAYHPLNAVQSQHAQYRCAQFLDVLFDACRH